MSGLVLTLFLLLPSPQSSRVSPTELVSAVSDYYARLNSLSADFEQILKDANRTTRVRGHVYLKSKRRARFDYVNPVVKSDYFDGKTHTRYLPGDENAIREKMGDIGQDERLLIFLILGNRESSWKDEFNRKEAGTVPAMFPGNQVVKLFPNNTESILDVLVEVDPATRLIHRFGFTRADKTYTEYVFTNIKTAPLDDSLFQFKAPPGVKIFER
jgi:outer membrane lipoprotein-sorting protein